MPSLIAVHSFRGGTGKSNSCANIATILAQEGRRVAVVDADIQSPGVHVIFGVDTAGSAHSLNDYLWGRCAIAEAAQDVTPSLDGDTGGKVFLIPSSIDPNQIARVIRDGYDVGLLNQGFRALISDLSLDALIIDTHPGLNEETLLSIAMADVLAIILRPDEQDYEGTSVTVRVARKLRVPRMTLIVNKTPSVFDREHVRSEVETAYDCEVAAVLPHSDEMMALSSREIFSLRYPDHPISELYRTVAHALVE
jgi:MinD-like ATPase involved in chromosome partitioning or flagellar assembly